MLLYKTAKLCKSPQILERQKNPCHICGQYLELNDKYNVYLNPKGMNLIIHDSEWEEFIDGLTNEEIHEKLTLHKRPKTKGVANLADESLDKFKEVLHNNKYYISKETKTRIYFKIPKAVEFYFDKRYGLIDYTGKRKQLFDSFFIKELKSRLWEEWQHKLGNNVAEGFRVKKMLEIAEEKMKSSNYYNS